VYNRFEFVVPTSPDGRHYFVMMNRTDGLSANSITSGLTEPTFTTGDGPGGVGYDYGYLYGDTGVSHTYDEGSDTGGFWIGYDPTEFVMPIPEGSYFMVTAVGVLVDIADNVTAQPQISFGVDGSNVSLVAATSTTGLTSAKTHWWTTGLSNPVCATTELRAAVAVMGTGTKLVGRFLFKGYLVEDFVAATVPSGGGGY
jgi:hypothetical protein